MTVSSLPFTQAPGEPTLKDVLDQLKKDIFLNLSCHHIGTIQSFDADNQTATVTINYKKTYYQLNAATGLYSPVLVDYPILTDCPVIVLGGAAAALTFPIAQGDECLVVFNDRDLDNWFQGGTGSENATPRLHSMADALVIVGLRSQGKVLEDYDPLRAVLRNGSILVGVSESLVKISNGTDSLGPILQDLIDQVKSLVSATAGITVLCAAPGLASSLPVNVAAITAVTAQLTATATKIAGLLE